MTEVREIDAANDGVPLSVCNCQQKSETRPSKSDPSFYYSTGRDASCQGEKQVEISRTANGSGARSGAKEGAGNVIRVALFDP